MHEWAHFPEASGVVGKFLLISIPLVSIDIPWTSYVHIIACIVAWDHWKSTDRIVGNLVRFIMCQFGTFGKDLQI